MPKGVEHLRWLTGLAALALILGAGVVQGLKDGRWSRPQALEAALGRLGGVALDLGAWRGRPLEFDRRQLAQAEILGHLARRYEDRRRGAAVTVLLVCGRPGPIAVHTPDVCFGGLGYALAGAPTRLPLAAPSGARPAEFWTADFHRPTAAGPARLRVFWSWSGGGPWQAPENPRWVFAPAPYLYKLYVVRETVEPAGRLADDPAVAFLRVLLPELKRALGTAS